VKIYNFISAFIYLYINGEYYILSQSWFIKASTVEKI
jgi:hypothetical protein